MTKRSIGKRGAKQQNKTKSIKISNKQKHGKRTKPRVKRASVTVKDNRNGPTTVDNHSENSSEDDEVADMVEDDDLEYLKSSYGKIGFLNNIRNNIGAGNEKRKHAESVDSSADDDEEEEEDYEKGVRKGFIPAKKMRSLLPLKDKHGLIPVSVEVQEEKEPEVTEEPEAEAVVDRKCDEPSTLVEMCARRQKLLTSRKQQVGVIAMNVIEKPEENINKLKELILMMDERNPVTFLSTQKMIALTLCEIFKDIIPSYSIRLPTEQEKAQRTKKETKALRAYEEALLRFYKKYLQRLEFLTTGLTNKGMQQSTDFTISKKVQLHLGTLAVRCFSELLTTHPHFNFHNNIIKVLSTFMAHKEEAVSDMCCNAFRSLYAEDKLGETSLEAVKLTSKLVKQRNMQVPAKVLETFLSLRISEASIKREEQQQKASKELKRKMQMMSRKEKKHRKRLQKLEKELQETEAEESKEKKSRFHTEMLNHVFVTYFRILKSPEPNSSLLTTVLAGLSKFAHLINVDFFDDLISIICRLLDSVDLTKLQTFHCLHTVFTILSGEGQALNIDPQRFYVHLYKNLLYPGLISDDQVTEALLKCIDIMVLKRRKKLTVQRTLAILKRLSTTSLQQSHAGALSFMACVKLIMQNCRTSEVVLDTEEGHGSGMYLPELEDPEYCNANATVLWELPRLRQHYHPYIQKYAHHISLKCPMQGEGQLPIDMTKKSPCELYSSFSTDNVEFNPPLLSLEQRGLKVGKKRKVHPHIYGSDCLVSEAKKLFSKHNDMASVNFYKCVKKGLSRSR